MRITILVGTLAAVVCVAAGVIAWNWGSSSPVVVPAQASPVTVPREVSVANSRGVLPAQVPTEFRKQVIGVIEAQRTNTHPERLSMQIAPEKFDAVKFAADPQAYLDVVEPGRVFQTAMATGPESIHLVIEGPDTVFMNENESKTLAVKGSPRGVVTFSATDGGRFDNHLSSITVQADDSGRASVRFTAERTISDANVLVGSPQAVGTACIIVHTKHAPDTAQVEPVVDEPVIGEPVVAESVIAESQP